MSLSQPIKDLEKAESIPQGTTYVAYMGNGQGVKAVTQEVLTKAVGEGLKIGDLEELNTKNKESLVDAINEAKQSGGGGSSVDILDTPEEIEANTEPEKVAGALAVKGMFGDLNFPDGTGFYPDVQNGVRGYNTDATRGADTFHPFSEIKLLWQNSDTVFSPQTIPINLTDYDGILIALVAQQNWASKTYFYIPKGVTQTCHISMTADATESAGNVWYRKITPLNSGVSIGYAVTNETTGVLPREIYGVKAAI